MTDDDNRSTTGATAELAAEWDATRKRFMNSMMVNTEIYKLAQNIDANWPLRGKDEVPLKYLPLPYAEVIETPGIAEKPERLGLLISILNETMAFDDPFGEMAEHVDSSSKKDDSALKTLQGLKIPEDFPIAFCNLSEETKRFCADEELETIGAFIRFSQNMAQSVVVGGDFRNFLNSFVHRDERAIATFLPTRPGREGVFLAEALGMAVAALSKPDYLAMLEEFGGEPSADDRKDVRRYSATERTHARERFEKKVRSILEYFGTEADRLRDLYAEGPSAVERYFVPLDHPNRERIAAGIARRALDVEDSPRAEKRRGFFSRLFGR